MKIKNRAHCPKCNSINLRYRLEDEVCICNKCKSMFEWYNNGTLGTEIKSTFWTDMCNRIEKEVNGGNI